MMKQILQSKKKEQKLKIQATNFVIVKNAPNFFFGSLNEQ